MCGRYNIIPKDEAWLDAFRSLNNLPPPPDLPARYNVTPTSSVPVIRQTQDKPETVMLRWGLIPFWAKGEPPKFSTINARGESIAEKPAYRGPWRRRQRCLIPASGFYEWQRVPGTKQKQPYHIRVIDSDIFAFGGLWDKSLRDDGEVLQSCTIVTTEPNELMAAIHDRMPLILPRDTYVDWLTGSSQRARELIHPLSAAAMEAYPISTFVNQPTNDNKRCVEPLAD